LADIAAPPRSPAATAKAVRAAIPNELSEAEWPLPGHVVADVVVECGKPPDALQFEILTVEDEGWGG
jgi:hypothetical protein